MGTSCSIAPTQCRRCLESEGGTPIGQHSGALAAAARSGDAIAVQSLIRSGAVLNTPDAHGWTALHYSAAAGHLDVCRMLVDHCCNVNATLPDFSTPLMLAAEEGHLSIAKFLLDSGALPKCKDEDGFTAQDRCDKNISGDVQKLFSQPVSERYQKSDGLRC